MTRRVPPAGRRPDDAAVARRLERYAREELDGDPGVLAEGRSVLLQRFTATHPRDAARSDAAAAAAAVPSAPGDAAPMPRSPLSRLRRVLPRPTFPAPIRLRLAAAGTIVVLALAGTGAGAVAASAPGGPLYDARIGLEALTLPAAGSPAWLDAEVRRLDERLGEAAAAAGSGNVQAVDAALTAYARILRDVVAATAGGPQAPAALERALGRHQAELERLAADEPRAAAGTIDNVLRDVEAAEGSAAGSGASGSNVPPGSATPTSGEPSSHPGWSVAPGKAGTAPGNSGTAPGHAGTAPGKAGSAPGHGPSATHEPAHGQRPAASPSPAHGAHPIASPSAAPSQAALEPDEERTAFASAGRLVFTARPASVPVHRDREPSRRHRAAHVPHR